LSWDYLIHTQSRLPQKMYGLHELSQLAPGQLLRDVLGAQVANVVAAETVTCESECRNKDLECKGKREQNKAVSVYKSL
jgi:hypothetical protein